MATELATRPPAFVDGKTQSANDLRLNVLSGSGGATPLQSRAGVRPSGGNPGLVAALVTPVMKVRVNAGIADVPSSSVTGGFYRVSWDQVDLDIDPSSAQARTDLIIVEVVDTGTSAATGKVRVLKGTSGAGRPSNAVVNAHWWSLGAVAVRVNAEGTGNIRPQDVTPELQYAVAPGGIIPVLAADVTAGAHLGQYRDHPTQGLQRWSTTNNAWHPVFPLHGSVASTVTSQNVASGANYTFTFPALPASVVPGMRVRCKAGIGWWNNSANVQTFQVNSVTATGATVSGLEGASVIATASLAMQMYREFSLDVTAAAPVISLTVGNISGGATISFGPVRIDYTTGYAA